jgi:hypothetical protein
LGLPGLWHRCLCGRDITDCGNKGFNVFYLKADDPLSANVELPFIVVYTCGLEGFVGFSDRGHLCLNFGMITWLLLLGFPEIIGLLLRMPKVLPTVH